MSFKINEKIAELVGIFIGDGFTNKYQRSAITEFSGNKNEWEYFNSILIPLIRHLSDVPPKIRIKRNNLMLRYNSVRLYEYITKTLKLKSGYKSSTIEVPNYILSRKKLYTHFLRGLFDIDGSIIWDKRKIYRTPYPRLTFTTISKKLALQVAYMLKELKFNPRVYIKKINNREYDYHVDLYGFEALKRWIKIIGFSNNKHINRLSLSSSAGRGSRY